MYVIEGSGSWTIDFDFSSINYPSTESTPLHPRVPTTNELAASDYIQQRLMSEVLHAPHEAQRNRDGRRTRLLSGVLARVTIREHAVKK